MTLLRATGCHGLRAVGQLHPECASVICQSLTCHLTQSHRRLVAGKKFICTAVRPPHWRHPAPAASLCQRGLFTHRHDFRPLYKLDKVAEDYELVYSNHMKEYYRWTPLAMLPLLPVVGYVPLAFFYERFSLPDFTWNESDTFMLMGSTFGAFLFSFVHIMCKRVMLRLYHNVQTDHFIAVVRTNYMKEKQVHFTMDQVKQRKTGSIFTQFTGRVMIRGKPYLLLSKDFAVLSYYNRLNGFAMDRPQDEADDGDVRELADALKKRWKELKK